MRFVLLLSLHSLVNADFTGALVCGTDSCKTEAELLHSSPTYNCDGSQAHKVTLVTTAFSNVDDGTFNSLAQQGAMAACSSNPAISCCLEIDMPNTTDTTDYFCEMEYAAVDSDMVIGVGFLHDSATHKAASCVTDTKFAAVDVDFQTWPSGNLEGIIFDEAQSGFLAGWMAGLVAGVSTNKKVGVITVAPDDVPPVKRFVTGFTNGVAEACPACADTVVKECGWGDGGFGAAVCGIEKAQELFPMGVDVIFGAGGYTGSMGITYAAAPVGTTIEYLDANTGAGSITKSATFSASPYVIGVDADEYFTTFKGGTQPGADKIITSALKKVDVGVQMSIGNYVAGNIDGSNFKLDAANGGIGFAPPNEATVVTPAMTAAVQAIYDKMKANSFSTRVSAMGICTAGPGPGCPPASPPPPPTPASPSIIFDPSKVDGDGNPILYTCGSLVGDSGVLSGCKAEEELLHDSRKTNCDGEYTTKITLVTTGPTIYDGTFNSLAMAGAEEACTAENSCCLEIDMPNKDTDENDYFCEVRMPHV